VYNRAFNRVVNIYPLRPYESYTRAITNPIPGPDGRVVVGNPYGVMTYYEYPDALRGPAFNLNMLTSPPGTPEQTFKTIETAATKRFSDGWQFMFSYSATKKNLVPPASNPNDEINTTDRTWEYTARASGAYRFPGDVMTSVNYEHRSGDAQAPNFQFRGGTTIPSIVLNTAPIGSIRMPDIKSVDVRVQKTFNLPKGQSFTARMNVYNVLNSNTVIVRNVRLGANYLRPEDIMPPTIFEFGVSYAF
jgi:hypothetical protein